MTDEQLRAIEASARTAAREHLERHPFTEIERRELAALFERTRRTKSAAPIASAA